MCGKGWFGGAARLEFAHYISSSLLWVVTIRLQWFGCLLAEGVLFFGQRENSRSILHAMIARLSCPRAQFAEITTSFFFLHSLSHDRMLVCGHSEEGQRKRMPGGRKKACVSYEELEHSVWEKKERNPAVLEAITSPDVEAMCPASADRPPTGALPCPISHLAAIRQPRQLL